ncbi:hypothetical protein IY40_13655 [Serratia marcescens]|nr:hypothetical protein IY40_13655 [Serratia marcescens]
MFNTRRSGELALFYAAARAADIGITPKAALPLIAQLDVVIGILVGGVRIGLAAAIGFLHRAFIRGIRFGARFAAARMIAFDIDAKAVLVACLCPSNRRFRRLRGWP